MKQMLMKNRMLVFCLIGIACCLFFAAARIAIAADDCEARILKVDTTDCVCEENECVGGNVVKDNVWYCHAPSGCQNEDECCVSFGGSFWGVWYTWRECLESGSCNTGPECEDTTKAWKEHKYWVANCACIDPMNPPQ